MKQFKTIPLDFIIRYFPPQDERIIAGYVRGIEILSEFIFDTVEEEARIILKDISEDRYEELRQVALSSYCFDVFGTRKSFFDGGGTGWIPFTEYGISFHKNFARMWNDMINEASKERRETVTAFKILSIDIETYSSNDISGCGVYKYAEAEDFAILLFAYSCDYGPVEIIDLASGEKLPDHIYKALSDPKILKTAFNATFERICLSKYFGLYLTSDQWECTMVRSAMLGLPLSLAAVGKVLNLEDQKMDEGKALIRYFSVPCKPTKTNGMRIRNLPEHAPDKWDVFKKYCKRDVEVENAIRQKTAAFRILPAEKELYDIDQRINDRGVMLDMQMVNNAIRMSLIYSGRLTAEAAELTGLDNPNSVAQLKGWLEQETGNEVKSLNKKDMPDIIKSADAEHVQRLLSIRQELGKTSVKKYEAMSKAVCEDDRVRGLLQFYGASRTGRWAGRLVQVQNLPQNHIEDLDFARSLVFRGDLDMLELCYGNVPDTLSQLIRTAFIAKPGHTFIVSDFSAIEARVIAWLAGEAWRLEVFRTHGKIYEATAALMYRVPQEEITKTDPRRQKGKIAELACIAKGQLVLTDQGYVPIECVTTDMLVWDGEEFVKHEGVIYKGIKEVITYEGLTATPDHIVWVKGENRPIQFGESANRRAHLQKSIPSRKDLWECRNRQSRASIHKGLEPSICTNKVLGLRSNTMDVSKQSYAREIKRLPNVFKTQTNTQMVGSKVYGRKTKMRKPQRWKLPKLRSQRYKILFLFRIGSRSLDDRALRVAGSFDGIRSDRCKWKLRTGKHEMGNTSTELCQSAKVYDLLNCGPRHRYTVNGVLVHNCGYQGGVGAMKTMGGEKMGLSEEEMKEIVTHWRSANPAIVGLWDEVQAAAMQAISGRDASIRKGVKFRTELGALTIELPSGRKLFYPRARIESREKFGRKSKTIIYEGQNQTTKKWEDLETYGGKLVENIVQGIARDCLAVTMVRLEKMAYPIVFHVHDEVILEVPDDGTKTLAEVCEVFKKPIVWAEGLPLKGDGYVTNYYKKD